MTLASLEDLRTYTTFTDDGQAYQALEHASGAIQAYLEQTVTEVADDIVTLDGTGSWALVLPERPVTAIDSIAVDGTLIDDADYTFDGPSGIVTRLNGAWGTKVASVVATYTHGYATVPHDIRAATLELAARALTGEGDQQARASQWGDLRVEYESRGGGRPGLLDPYAMLARYRVPAVA